MGVLQDSEDHAVEQFEEVLNRAPSVDVPVPADAVPEATLVAAWLGRSGIRVRLIAKVEALDLIESIKTYGDAREQKHDEMHEANGEAAAQMINEARKDAIALAQALRDLTAEASYYTHNDLGEARAGIIGLIRAAKEALAGHVAANRSSGWDAATWKELGR